MNGSGAPIVHQAHQLPSGTDTKVLSTNRSDNLSFPLISPAQ